MPRPFLQLAVAFDALGWHPAAWRRSALDAKALWSGSHWAGLVAEAERGLLDFVTFGLPRPANRYAPTPDQDRSPSVAAPLANRR
ncbi:hypothetical protein [Plantactinospora sp. DSM 117369]